MTDLYKRSLYSVGTVRVHRKGLPEMMKKKQKLKRGEFRSQIKGCLAAVKWCTVNRQIRVGDSKNVIVFEPLLTGHVIRRMRSGRVRILNGNQRETL